jgi:hypothetical protein
MNIMELLNLYNKCLNANYKTIGDQSDYAIKRVGSKLYLFFEWSDSAADWKNNFNFPSKPYKDMGITWRCHRGFLKVWKSIEPYVKDAIMKPTVKSVTIVGYSHGAAIATLCHEYVWFNRPDLRNKLDGYGFGSPRVFWGNISEELRERWANFHIVRNLNDIVTHMPPKFFGFRHVNDVIEIGEDGKMALCKTALKCIEAHRPENYIYSMENQGNDRENK